jgi:ABC-type glycerol-3-phosphate transport system permease component
MKRKGDLYSIIIYILLVLLAIFMLLPFFWMITSSFKPFHEVTVIPSTLFPKEPTLENYVKMNKVVSITIGYRNSLWLAAIKTLIILYTSSLVGYIVSKIDFRFNKTIFVFVLSTMMIPWPVVIIPQYQEMVWLHWVGKYTALIVPAFFSSFGIFLMKQFIDGIPGELMEASRCDGATEWTIFHRVVLPNMGPALSALAIFQFLWIWDDFLWPFLMINRSEKYTLPLVLRALQGQYFNDYGPIFAAATVSVVPVLIIYIIFQRRFVEGITMTGIRG